MHKSRILAPIASLIISSTANALPPVYYDVGDLGALYERVIASPGAGGSASLRVSTSGCGTVGGTTAPYSVIAEIWEYGYMVGLDYNQDGVLNAGDFFTTTGSWASEYDSRGNYYYYLMVGGDNLDYNAYDPYWVPTAGFVALDQLTESAMNATCGFYPDSPRRQTADITSNLLKVTPSGNASLSFTYRARPSDPSNYVKPIKYSLKVKGRAQ